MDSPPLASSRSCPLFALAAATFGWLFSYLGLFAAVAFSRAHCATGGGSEMQMLGLAWATLVWLLSLGLLALGRRGLGRTGWLGLGHAAAFVPAVVWLAPALWRSTLGGLAVCVAFEESSVREQWPLPATLLERLHPVATPVMVAAFAVTAVCSIRRGRLAALRGPPTAGGGREALGAALGARSTWRRGRHLLGAASMALLLLLGVWLVQAHLSGPQAAGGQPRGPGIVPATAQNDAETSDEERCRRAGWPSELRLEETAGPRVVDCHRLYCSSLDACDRASLPSGQAVWCGDCALPRVCNPATKSCCSRRSDAELCASCGSADEVLAAADCGLSWRVICDGCCVSDRPLTEGIPLGLIRLASGSVVLEPGGRALLEQSEVEQPATTVGSWRQEGDGLVARFEVDTATRDSALIDFTCVEHVANEEFECAEGDRDACLARELDRCVKASWGGIERRFGRRSARFEVTVEIERGPKGELLSRIQGRDPNPVPGRERFEAPGSAEEFKVTDDCFFVPR